MSRSLIWSIVFVVAVAGCSSSNNNGPTGGAVTGVQDNHCIMNDEQVKTPVGACITAGTPIDSGASDDGGASGDAGGAPEFGDPMFNAEADDDDCKYHVKWSVSDVCENHDTTFEVTVTAKAGGAPVTGATPDLEVFLDSTHPAPNSGQHATENGGGKYTVGPVRFDASGRWTVRFHFFEDCEDALEDSPHGHAAFFVDVP